MLKFLKTGFRAIINSLFSKGYNEEEIEKVLYEADLGSTIVSEFMDALKRRSTPEECLEALEQRAFDILQAPPLLTGTTPPPGHPKVILIVGVNGAGKTTTIAKLAKLLKSKGETVLIAAGDTFRAAAIDQLEVLSHKIGVALMKTKQGANSSGVLYDALAKGKGYSTILVDTAGRLESKTDLMHELEKLRRVSQKFDTTSPHETYLIVDATLGQTALEQARTFHKFTPLTGFILTKLDGSTKGGIALPLYKEIKIPITYITFGETLDAIAPFDPKEYAHSLFSK